MVGVGPAIGVAGLQMAPCIVPAPLVQVVRFGPAIGVAGLHLARRILRAVAVQLEPVGDHSGVTVNLFGRSACTSRNTQGVLTVKRARILTLRVAVISVTCSAACAGATCVQDDPGAAAPRPKLLRTVEIAGEDELGRRLVYPASVPALLTQDGRGNQVAALLYGLHQASGKDVIADLGAIRGLTAEQLTALGGKTVREVLDETARAVAPLARWRDAQGIWTLTHPDLPLRDVPPTPKEEDAPRFRRRVTAAMVSTELIGVFGQLGRHSPSPLVYWLTGLERSQLRMVSRPWMIACKQRRVLELLRSLSVALGGSWEKQDRVYLLNLAGRRRTKDEATRNRAFLSTVRFGHSLSASQLALLQSPQGLTARELNIQQLAEVKSFAGIMKWTQAGRDPLGHLVFRLQGQGESGIAVFERDEEGQERSRGYFTFW